MQTLIRLLLQEQSDLGLHCLSRLFVFMSIVNVRAFTLRQILIVQYSFAIVRPLQTLFVFFFCSAVLNVH